MEPWEIASFVVSTLFNLIQIVTLYFIVYIIRDNKRVRARADLVRQISCAKNDIIKLLIKRQTASRKEKVQIDAKIEQLELKIKQLENTL